MPHVLVALWCPPEVDPAPVVDAWAVVASDDNNVRACTASLAVADQGRFARGDPLDALFVLDVWDAASVPTAVLEAHARELGVWEVEPRRIIESDDPTAVTMVSFVERAAHMTPEEFARHWTGNHGPLARRHHTGLAGYTQHVVQRTLSNVGAEIDGIAELRFRTRADFDERMYGSDEGRDIIREDVRRFIARPSGQAGLLHEVLRITR